MSEPHNRESDVDVFDGDDRGGCTGHAGGCPASPTGGQRADRRGRSPRKHFCEAIVGRRGSGKTTLCIDLLCSVWKHKFDLIVFVSTTAHLQKEIWKQLSPKGIKLFSKLNAALIRLLKDYMKDNPDKHLLLIVDDMGLDTRDERKAEEFNNLSFTSRHHRISMVILAQRYTLISPAYRSQLDRLYLFNLSNTHEIAQVSRSFWGGTQDSLREALSKLEGRDVLVLTNKDGKVTSEILRS